ncbi:MAG: hypothetical protein ERJ67_06740 [Aphanocapsa feldmannii 277cV]|uniref:Uncharacterized protein n=1 Tax=Aphanocapsa feldmannii 277cV TaxID=2507553 RepID=A0A524RMZ6_9CHRO|nr:MAG: hypothetical protein ERJ67_06740 [Aphanocapsa feldmannii 277cV]
MSQQDEARTTDGIDAITRLAFSIHGNPGVYALLLGSGLSRAAGIPTGWEITLDLVSRVAIAQGEVDHQPDWSVWYRREHGKEPDYSDLIGQLAPCPDERRAILEDYIEPTEEENQQEGRKVPTKAHKAIADLVHDGFIRVIITTNFDRLLEKALSERGIEPTVVDSVDAIQGAEPLVHTKCYLVKLHGDYKDTRIRNTNNELSKYDCKFNKLLARIFDDYGLIVCGWSGEWDKALHQAIMRNPSRRYSFFWTQRGTTSDSGNKIIKHRKGSIISIDNADNFFGKLRDRVQTLAQTRRQDPANVDLLVNMTKRFAAKPEHRIELEDLLDSEVQRLLRRLIHHTSQGYSDPNIFRKLVGFYESSTETLGCMFGVLGRWGDSTAHDAVVNAIFHLLSQFEAMQPKIKYLRYYPAILLFWAYGIGLTAANRLGDLHDLLSRRPIPNSTDNYLILRKRFIYFIIEEWYYKVNAWNFMPDLESSETPFSDHLFKDIFDKWRKNFAPILADFKGIYDTWEILLALTYCEKADDEMPLEYKLDCLRISDRAWRLQRPERICKQIRNLRRELITAGFADGNEERLAEIIDEYEQIMKNRYKEVYSKCKHF